MTRYRQLTSEQRTIIAHLRSLKQNYNQIAQQIGCHRATVSREVKRNHCQYDGFYRSSKAHMRALSRRKNARSKAKFSVVDMVPVILKLKEQWSPEQISGELAKSKKLNISHETIYRYVWEDKAQGGTLWKNLRQSGKKRRKRYGANDSRGRLADKRPISERPASVETRRYKGHWEIDTVHGKGSKDCIVTLVERKTGYTVIGKLPNKTTAELNAKVIKLLGRFKKKFRTITSDNGTEFHGYKEIEKARGTKFYFAKPYHSWERGTNENTNGLIRQYLPKGTSMEHVTQKRCDEIATKLNQRPRKRLGYETPSEMFLFR